MPEKVPTAKEYEIPMVFLLVAVANMPPQGEILTPDALTGSFGKQPLVMNAD